MRFAYSMTGTIKFLSHLDLMQVFARGVRRAGLPVAYSQGFNPHPKIALGPAHVVGIASLEEWGDMELSEQVAPKDFVRALNAALPQGLTILDAFDLPPGTPSLQATLNGADYLVMVDGVEEEQLRAALDQVMASDSLLYEKYSPKGKKLLELRPGIYSLQLEANKIKMELAVGDRCNVRPQYVLSAMAIPNLQIISILRQSIYIRREDGGREKLYVGGTVCQC